MDLLACRKCIQTAATNSRIRIAEGKESVDMCLAIQEMREESRLEGFMEGELKGELKGAIVFAKELGLSRAEVKKAFMEKYGKSDGETEELMEIYWK